MIKDRHLEIRPATQQDAIDFCGYQLPGMRADIALLDGKRVALGGTFTSGAYIRGFAELREPLRKSPKALLKFAKHGMSKIRERRVVVVALAEKHAPRAAPLLNLLGFDYIDSTQIGEWFILIPQKEGTE